MLDLGVDELGTDVRFYAFNFRDKLLNRFGSAVRSVVVFGSRARGNWKPWSDVDIFVVLKEAPKGMERLKAMPHEPLIQPWVYTEDEVHEALRSFDIALLDALEHGIVLHDDGFWRGLKGQFSNFKEEWELVEVDEGWISRKLERLAEKRS